MVEEFYFASPRLKQNVTETDTANLSCFWTKITQIQLIIFKTATFKSTSEKQSCPQNFIKTGLLSKN